LRPVRDRGIEELDARPSRRVGQTAITCDAANRPATVTGLAPTFATETVDAGYRMTLVEFPNGVESVRACDDAR